MTYREKEYFTVVRTRQNMKNSPFMLFLVKGSSKERIEQELSDANLVPFKNKLMTRQQFLKQDKEFFNRVGIVDPEFEADAVTAIARFANDKSKDNFDKVAGMLEKAKNSGYCSEDNIYMRLQNTVVLA